MSEATKHVQKIDFQLPSKTTEQLLTDAVNFCLEGGEDNLRFARYHLAELARRGDVTNLQLREAYDLMVGNQIHSTSDLAGSIIDKLEGTPYAIPHSSATSLRATGGGTEHFDRH